MSLKKYILNRDLAFEYFCKSINNSNELSTNLFNNIDLKKKGQFFAFFSAEMDVQHIHNFTCGGIAKNSKDMIINFLMKKLLSKQNYCLIFDDVLEDCKSLSGYSLFKKNGVSYKNESYYLINPKKHLSFNLIRECLRASDAEWHCLGILFQIDLDKFRTKTITSNMIHDICVKADLILTTAYDGEGYIFWER